jgi:hypothetical protein
MATPEVKVNPNANTRVIRKSSDRITNLLSMIKTTGDSGRTSELLTKIKSQSDLISQEIGGSQPVSRRRKMQHLPSH